MVVRQTPNTLRECEPDADRFQIAAPADF